ncbi:unnamed protein product [Lampetra planeri]
MRATLQQTYKDLPSNTRKKFLQQRRGEAEMPLVYHSALMALGQVVYPCMDKTALDSLAMEKMLVLAQEMGVMLPIVEEEAQISLWVARCLQAH